MHLSLFAHKPAQSAGAVKYADCTFAEGVKLTGILFGWLGFMVYQLL